MPHRKHVNKQRSAGKFRGQSRMYTKAALEALHLGKVSRFQLKYGTALARARAHRHT